MEIKFNNVDYVYNLKTPFENIALLKINLEFKMGMINGIIGSSGSGKTTLIELIKGFKKPVKGKITRRIKRNIGIVFQNPEDQFFCNTVLEEIEYGLRKKGNINDILSMINLDSSILSRNPLSLSSGEKRKVAIASVLALNPEVIIFDEPTIGLDSSSKKDLIKLIRSIKNDYKRTVIIVTRDADLIYEIADYIYVMDKALKVLEGTKSEVFNSPIFKKLDVKAPKIIEFEKLVLKRKNIKLRQSDNVNDLIKEVYRHVK